MEDFEVQDYSTGLSRFYSIEGAEILEIRDVIKVINKDMKELSDEFNLCQQFKLFVYYNWNREEILQKYFCSTNQEGLLIQLKAQEIVNDHGKIMNNNLYGICSVCFCDGKLIQLGCTHQFCESCIEQTIKKRVSQEKFLELKCLQNGCNYRLPKTMLIKHCNPQEFENIYIYQSEDISTVLDILAYCTGVDWNKILKLTLG